jgi:hypothetical protein
MLHTMLSAPLHKEYVQAGLQVPQAPQPSKITSACMDKTCTSKTLAQLVAPQAYVNDRADELHKTQQHQATVQVYTHDYSAQQSPSHHGMGGTHPTHAAAQLL